MSRPVNAPGSPPPAEERGNDDAPQDSAVGSDQLGQIADRALVFQNFLLRRAWGVYYLTWSAALTGLFVVPSVLTGPLSSAPLWALVLYYVYLVGVIALATWATAWAFTQSARAVRLRQLREARSVARRRFLQVLAVSLGITALVFAVSYLSSFAGLLVLDASLGAVIVWLLIQVRAWFSRPPPEATIAISTYGISVVGSALVLLLTHQQALYADFWLLATVAWAFCGTYALYHSPEEMTGGVS